MNFKVVLIQEFDYKFLNNTIEKLKPNGNLSKIKYKNHFQVLIQNFTNHLNLLKIKLINNRMKNKNEYELGKFF